MPRRAASLGFQATLALLLGAGVPATTHEGARARAAGSASGGEWRLAAPMSVPRAGHSATLLPSGKVLVAGGWSLYDSTAHAAGLDSAEVYDPATSTWSLTGPMVAPRIFHAAVLLRDGRVLVAGGCSGHYPYLEGWALCVVQASAELFDPATGTWSPTGGMARARKGPGVLLADGRVLVAGTETPRDGDLPTIGPECEIYDPATGTWSGTGAMGSARSNPGLVLLPSGLVLAAGGTTFDVGGASKAAELFEPNSGTWWATASLDVGLQDQVMLLLPTGEVLLASGRLDARNTGMEPLHEGRLYDPVRETWRPTARMTYRRERAAGVVLSSGRVLLAGGNFYEGGGWGATGWYPAPGGDLYDPWLDRWTPTPVEPHYVMYRSAAVALPGGEALHVGGNLYDGDFGWSNLISVDAAQVFRE